MNRRNGRDIEIVVLVTDRVVTHEFIRDVLVTYLT